MDLPELIPSQNPPPPQQAATAPDSDKTDIEQNKDVAAFSYLWIMSVVVYFLKRKSPFVRFHAKQAMVLFALSVVVMFIPIVSRVLALCVLALMVLGFVHAAQGQRKDVPIVGPLSRGEIGLRDAWRQLVDAVVKAVHFLKSLLSSKKSPPSSSSSSTVQAKQLPPTHP